jgi:hypothetical protein
MVGVGVMVGVGKGTSIKKKHSGEAIKIEYFP